MRTREIQNTLDTLLCRSRARSWFVLPRNYLKLVHIKRFPCAIIMNTDDWPGVGGVHWIGLWYDVSKRLTFFDSLGLPPSAYGLILRPYEWNKKVLQGNSDLCGEYSLLFIDLMSKGGSLRQVLKLFSNNKMKNDRLVHHYFKRIRPSQSHIHCTDVDQSCAYNCQNGRRQNHV